LERQKPHRVREEYDFTRVSIRTLIWAESDIGPFFIENFLPEKGCLEFLRNTMTPETEQYQEI